MILVRMVCRAKFGKANDVVALFKGQNEIGRQVFGDQVHTRILTDLSGPFDTVVLELAVESLAEWERVRKAMFTDPRMQEMDTGGVDLVEGGRTEYYTIEAES